MTADLFAKVVTFFQHGGIFMYPIAAILVLGLAITLERWLFLNRSARQTRALWMKALPMMEAGDYAGAERVAEQSDSAMGRVLAYGFAHSRNQRSRGEVELAMEEALMEVTSLLEKRTHYLATFANVSTLLGLLGTISGLIAAFAAIASLNLAEKTDVLAASISEALNATAFGLLVAVPFLLIHSWLTTKTGDLVDSLEMATVKFLNSLNLRPAAA